MFSPNLAAYKGNISDRLTPCATQALSWLYSVSPETQTQKWGKSSKQVIDYKLWGYVIQQVEMRATFVAKILVGRPKFNHYPRTHVPKDTK